MYSSHSDDSVVGLIRLFPFPHPFGSMSIQLKIQNKSLEELKNVKDQSHHSIYTTLYWLLPCNNAPQGLFRRP